MNELNFQDARPAASFNEEKEPITLQVYTKVPTKWLLVDRETGEVYEGNEEGAWDRLDPVVKRGYNK
jgi:hypothetical protein